MKKILFPLFAVILIFTVTSCKNDDGTYVTTTNEYEETVTFVSETTSEKAEENISSEKTDISVSLFSPSYSSEETTHIKNNDAEEEYFSVSVEEPAATKAESTTQETEEADTSEEFSEETAESSDYFTEASVSQSETAEEASDKKTCYIQILCTSVLGKTDSLPAGKSDFIPSDGIILPRTEITLNDSETVFDILSYSCQNLTCSDNCSYCKAGGIQFEYTYTPAFNNYYIEGIHQLYEKDCGSLSGWMYSVNGSFPNVGMSSYEVFDGDEISILYTCDMGADIGNTF